MNIDELLLQDHLPSVPAVALRILKLIDDDATSSVDLANEVRTDLAMSAQLLRLANSSRYCPNREVTSLLHAVSMLGRSTVAASVLTFTLSQYVETNGELRDEFNRYWRSSVLQAISAELLAGDDRVKGDEYFMIGLMADIGRLAMICSLRNKYTDLLSKARKSGECLHEAEEAAFGFSHTTVSCRLARQWGLPLSLIDAIRLQHTDVADIVKEPGVQPIDAVARIGSYVADLFENQAAANTAVSVDCIAGQFFGISAESLLQATRKRVGEMRHVFNVDSNSLPPVVEIMANANAKLAKLLMLSTAPALGQPLAESQNTNKNTASEILMNSLSVITRDDFDICAGPYVEKCLESNGAVGMLLIQCHTADICQNRSDEDRFIRSVRETLRASIKPEDLVARFEGHYVCVLCRLDSADELIQMADRLQRVLVAEYGLPAVIPTSIGGVAISGNMQTTIAQLQQLAFFRLEKARQNRNHGTDVSVIAPTIHLTRSTVTAAIERQRI